jgi:iron complex outermembrane recepter protein
MGSHNRHWEKSVRSWRFGALLMCCVALATGAQAQQNDTRSATAGADTASLLDQTFDFDVPAQKVSTAILDIARQANVQAIMTGNVLDNYNTEGVQARLSLAAALGQVLSGTPYAYRQTGSNAIMVGMPEALAANTANASEPAPIADIDSARRAGVEEIIVTGQKKAERLQDVPIAISAFSMETLDAQKIEGGFDLLKAVPNVTFSKTNFSGYNFQIRGIGTQAISATTDPGVAVSFNNTTLIVNRLFEQEYLDIERVEVLRGPQGTLFGRNATAGVINVISAKPVLGEEFGEIKLEGGNYAAQRIRGHYNLPIGDTLALRAAYASTERDGFGYNEYSEVTDNPYRDPVAPDVDNRDLWTGRLSLGWEPSERLRVNLLYEKFEEDDRRVRTSKQLCTRDPGEQYIRRDGSLSDASQYIYSALSQGCQPGSLYADAAFGTPNGASLPYLSGLYWGSFYADSGLGGFAGASVLDRGLGGIPYISTPAVPGSDGLQGCQYFGSIPVNPPCDPTVPFPQFGEPVPPIPAYNAPDAPCETALGEVGGALIIGAPRTAVMPVDVCNPDVFRGRMQSRDLRTISSQLEPKYQADAEIFELAFDLDLTDGLLFSSQTVYTRDTYYATQDYNRFSAFPIWPDSSIACDLSGGAAGTLPSLECGEGDIGNYADGFYAGLSPRPEGTPVGTPGVVCDPQLGCSDTLLIQDLSRSTSRQFNQEVRLVSSFDSDFNFSVGANYTRFETLNDYYVFANALTHLLNFFPFQSAGSRCVGSSSHSGGPATLNYDGDFCRYVDPNPLASINGEGHNYFRSANPYKLSSAALFGELYWQATETVKLTAGLRFTWDEKTFTPRPSQLLLADYRDVVSGESPAPEACTETITRCPFASRAVDGRGSPSLPDIIQEWRVPTGRLGFDWKPMTTLPWLDETMIYGFYSRGYKGGGANPPGIDVPAGFVAQRASGGFVAPPTFKAEYVNAYEIGTKNTLLGGAVTLNASAFYYDYTDYQISKILDRSAFNENFDATVWGLELESFIAPTPDLLFNVVVGYLNTRVADGESSIDLMDRTDGGHRHYAAPEGSGTDFPEGFDEWVVIQPWVVSPSNCVVPAELIEANFLTPGVNNFLNAYCPGGNIAGASTAGLDVAHFVYDDEGNRTLVETEDTDFNFNPAYDAPNGGQGFSKDLSGHELPNAPQWTVSLGAQQTFYLPGQWDMTTRVDWYWQDESYARIYNMPDYDRLKAWTNTNLSIWFHKADWGLKVETYVKNLFDETPITGAFLNSDDSGLTTNIFTLDPRLFGLSITKSF